MKATRHIIIRKHRESTEKSARPLRFLKGLGLTLIVLILFAMTGVGIYYAIFAQSFPPLDRIQARYGSRPEPTRFYARDGETLLFVLAYENFESRDLAFCEEDGEGCFPKTFTEAVRLTRGDDNSSNQTRTIAEEMVREVYREFIAQSKYPDFTARLLSRQAIRVFGEEQLYAWYYNSAWFGQMAFGLDAAARLYLDKSGDQLSDAECVLLSAIINSPMLNPIDSGGAVRDSYLRQLSRLYQAGLFSEAEAEELARTNFVIFEPPQYSGGAEPDLITRKALDAAVLLYGREEVERGGLRIITSEDITLQAYLRCVTSVDNEAEDTACPLSATYADTERDAAAESLRTAPVSAAILDVNNGQLLAALEAQTTNDGQRVYAASQQAYPIGSSMNYFAALSAFSGGSAPSTLLWDLENSYESGTAANGDSEAYHGPIQLREALTEDYQRPLTAHIRTFGSGTVQRNAALFGLNNSHMLSDGEILYNGGSYTAEALAFSLIPFAASGEQSGTNASGSMHPVSILRIERDSGETEFPQPTARKSLIAGNLAWLVHNVFLRESGNLSLPDRPSAAKMGQAVGDDSRWMSGYTTEISCAMRIGNPRTVSAFVTDNDQVEQTAEILWRSVMEYAHRELPASGWDTPSDISLVRVCLPSGKLPTSACQETATEVFLRGNEPYEYDEYYVSVPINRENRMLATRYTPAEDIVTETFFKVPDDAAQWSAENGIEQMPTEYDPIREPRQSGSVRIESPSAFQTFRANRNETIDIVVRLSFSQQPQSLQVSIGAGMYPTQWEEVCSGGALDNGQWRLCSLDPSTLDPGVYALRTAFTFANQSYQSAETYFEVE